MFSCTNFSYEMTNWKTKLPSKRMFSWRRLEDLLIKTNIFALVTRLQKTSSRRFDQDQYIRFGHTPSRCLQNVFKTFSRRLQDVLQNRLQEILKTFPRRLQDIFKTSCQDVFKTSLRRLAKTSWIHLIQDAYKTSSRRLAKMP